MHTMLVNDLMLPLVAGKQTNSSQEYLGDVIDFSFHKILCKIFSLKNLRLLSVLVQL